jgi:hypothetical protein
MGECRLVSPQVGMDVPKASQENIGRSDCSSDCEPEYNIDILLMDMVMSILEDLQEVIDKNMGTLW